MPHVVVRSYRKFDTPQKSGDFLFEWFAEPLKHTKESLVALRYKERPFLLRIKPKEDRFVIKSDKITRISPTFLVKEALARFCKLADCEVLHDNLSSIKPSHAAKAKEFYKNIDFFIENFPTQKEVWIEIGFGSARHLLFQAEQNPHIQFIGIEIHKPSIEQALKQIALRKLENVLILDYDARLFLEFVPSNIVGKIFVHFPVPWDKKPHRRIFSKKFIQEAKRVLKPGGILELRTDSRLYFDYVMELLLEQESVDLEVTKNLEPPITSKYEDRWRRLGKDIFDVRMIVHETSDPIDLDFDFSFSFSPQTDKIEKNFDNSPKVFEDFFIHFQKLYRIDSDKLLIELSFGSFDRPEHRYLLIDKDIKYFPKMPVPSRANIAAHKRIEELLNA